MQSRDFYGFYSWLFITLLIPYFISLFPFLPPTFAGFSWTGWSWLLMLMATGYYFFKNPKYSFPIHFWLPWIIYIFGYLFFFKMSFVGLQLSLQYVLPLFVGMVASGFTYGKKEYRWLFKRLLIVSMFIALLYIVGYFIGFLIPGWANTVIFLSIPATIVLGMYFLTKEIKYLLLYGVFFLVPFILVTRMALLVFVVILVLHFANNRLFMKVLAGLLGLVLLLFVFNSEGFQQKTFFKGKGDLSDLSINYYEAQKGVVNTSGRAVYFRHFEKGLWESPVFGKGPRADYYVMRSFTTLNEAHNDYLSIAYNYGFTGIILFFMGYLRTFYEIFKRYRISNKLKDPYVFLLTSNTLTIFIAYSLFMYTDNIIKYTIFFPDIFFAMIGIVFAQKNNTL